MNHKSNKETKTMLFFLFTHKNYHSISWPDSFSRPISSLAEKIPLYYIRRPDIKRRLTSVCISIEKSRDSSGIQQILVSTISSLKTVRLPMMSGSKWQLWSSPCRLNSIVACLESLYLSPKRNMSVLLSMYLLLVFYTYNNILGIRASST
jgi:hypothetical protein